MMTNSNLMTSTAGDLPSRATAGDGQVVKFDDDDAHDDNSKGVKLDEQRLLIMTDEL